ncbi:hypothetical protein [Streptomyces sp. NPDC002758]
MAETPAATAKADSTSPAEPDDIPAGQALPGIRLIAYRVPECGISGSYLHMDRADIHVTYTQAAGRSGQFPAQGVAYGLRTVRGRDVNSWLRGSLNFWLSSDARVTDDGVIRYRQTRNHSVVTFVPDNASGILINRPDEQVTAAAYRVTGPTGVTQLWRGQAVRDAIGTCRRKPPVGWPEGWAHLLPDASVTFKPGGPMGPAGCLHRLSSGTSATWRTWCREGRPSRAVTARHTS